MWQTAVGALHQEHQLPSPLAAVGQGIQRSSCYTVMARPSNPPIEALGRAVNLKRHELGSDDAATASKKEAESYQWHE